MKTSSNAEPRKYTTLNHLFSSYVAIGRPETFCLKEKYLELDGHVVRCSSTFFLDRNSLPHEIIEALPEGKEACAWASARGLMIGYGVNGDLCAVAVVTALPKGYFQVDARAERADLAFRPFVQYGEIVDWGLLITRERRARIASSLTAVAPARSRDAV